MVNSIVVVMFGTYLRVREEVLDRGLRALEGGGMDWVGNGGMVRRWLREGVVGDWKGDAICQ